MLKEISFGVKFLRKLLESKVPTDQLDKFVSNLTSILQNKDLGHWQPAQPNHGNAYRCIHTTADILDPVLRSAAEASEIPTTQIVSSLPSSLTIWIDPSEVS
jgi:hypothetical protein